MKRGVKAPLAVDIRAANASLMARVAQDMPLPHVDGQRARFILVDGASILAFLIQEKKPIRGDAETALWTNRADFVLAHRGIFEKSWSSGTPAKDRLRASNGPDPLLAPRGSRSQNR